MKIEIPNEVPVMTMSGTVLFPQAMMPLYIFEPRYRQMLQEVLNQDRIFAIAAMDETSDASREMEMPHRVAGIGMVRACKTNSDGTSNLILQGLTRVKIESFIQEEPYRKARIRPITSEPGGSFDLIEMIGMEIISLVQSQIQLGATIPHEVVDFLKSIKDPEVILDLTIHTLCPSGELRQSLLETSGILPRFHRFRAHLQDTVDALKLDRKLRGDLDGDELSQN
jgi:ATP-dependent Lon protease